jgi:transporter family-2 protein
MGRLVAVIATVGVGALIAFQPPLNSELAKRSSVLGAGLISVLVSALVMAAIATAFGEIGQLRQAGNVSPVYLLGGVFGAALVTVSLVTVRKLGAGGVVAATVTGQLIVSAIIDRYGLFGVERIGLTPMRLAGLVLLLAGTALVTAR